MRGNSFWTRDQRIKNAGIHETAIISVSRSSTEPFFTDVRGCLVVQKIGVSLSNLMSSAKCDLGAGN